ncbi:MAG TPA: four-carbon acid sugar kinase family protein [Longimicrobiaceae bacterium]
MIVVIADDLSGAAELAEVARSRGHTAEVHTRFDPGVDADVVCVDAGSRGLAPGSAAGVTGEVLRGVMAAAPKWIYLKFDSVLRGHARVVLRAAMEATGRARALLVPANPSRGRTIRGGRYLIDGVPLDATAFAADPEHPRRSAEVATLLGGDLTGIGVPDVADAGDLARLAAGADAGTLVAGAAEFFEALLALRSGSRPARRQWVQSAQRDLAPGPGAVTLLVCGSQASWGTRRREAEARGVAVFDLEEEATDVARALEEKGVALAGIGLTLAGDPRTPAELVSSLADRVVEILGRVRPDRLLLEGGATAAAVVRASGWTRLIAVPGGGPGTGALRPVGEDRPTLFIKPGSYPWPLDLWKPADR